MKTLIFALLAVAVVGVGLWVRPVAGQQVGRAAVGGAAGVAGGTVITLSVIVARARFSDVYLDSVEDLVHWQTLPMIVTPAVGAFFGWTSGEALRGSLIGSTGGMLIGTAVGAGIGWLASDQPESPWAGGVIGAGLGLTIGGVLMGARGWAESSGDNDARPVRLGVTVPL